MEEASSKFNINTVRDICLLGEGQYVSLLKKQLKPYYFLAPKDAKDIAAERVETFYVAAALDFRATTQVQAYVRLFSEIKTPLAHKLAYVVHPEIVSREQLLLLQEVGARYVAYGMRRNDEFKEYLKRVCTEAHQVGSLDAYAADLEAARRRVDPAAIKKLLERLREIPNQSEDVLRLSAQASIYVNDMRRAEVYLKKILTLNSQNLWAANTLGRFYLRAGKVSEGVEMLERLSRFHELNSERMLELGNAYVKVGMTAEAEAHFDKGRKLAGQDDERFKEGLAKVKLANRDQAGALSLVGARKFSVDVLSFLNMRAIMAARAGRFDEGIEYYKYAFDGSGDDKDVKAKLKFNLGLAYVKTADLAAAEMCFFESAQLGGNKFSRAAGPLKLVRNQIKVREKVAKDAAAGQATAPTPKEADEAFEEVDWETLY